MSHICDISALRVKAKCFCYYLYGHHFSLVTDQQPLFEFIQCINEEQYHLRPQQGFRDEQASTLAMYEYSLKLETTTQLGNADTMSHLPLPDTVTLSLPETIFLLEFLDKSPVMMKLFCFLIIYFFIDALLNVI